MKISINCNLKINEEECLRLALSLIKNRPPKAGSYDYGFETHGVFDWNTPHPVQVYQTNKRCSNKSPICILIEKHTPF